MKLALALAFVIAACGSSQPVASIDASPDAVELDQNGCPPYPVEMLSIADGDTAYTPKLLQFGQRTYVRFTTSSMHDMNFYIMGGQEQQPFMTIGFSTTRCIYYPQGPAFYDVKCSVHGEVATVRVANPGP